MNALAQFMKVTKVVSAGRALQAPEKKYYHHVRREIRPLLPKTCAKILDVGAGAGGTLKWLKSIYPHARTTGVELNPDLAGELRGNADVAINSGIDEALPQLETYDLILLLDVLEHLVDSAGTLRSLCKRLNPGGQVIVSVPNIAHVSVLFPLLFRRRFTYGDAGILDRTHLRFFVEETAVQLLNDADLVVTAGLISGLQARRYKYTDRLSLGVFRHYLGQQYIMLGQLHQDGARQGRVAWDVAPDTPPDEEPVGRG
jgi:SAM-dependent methyltransferase